MSNPDMTNPKAAVATASSDGGSQPIDELLNSPEMARAVEDEDFQRFLDSIPIGIAVSRQSERGARVAYANPAFLQITGRDASAIHDRTWRVVEHFRHEDETALTLADAAARGSDLLGIFRHEPASGEVTLVQAYVTAIEKEDGSERYRVLALVDVSTFARNDREDYERQIQSKDVMLKELQHRVKNNLQLITALIRLESRNARKGEPVDLQRLAGRIEALAVLYRTLEADSFGPELDLGPYLSQIATAAIKANAADGIALETRMEYAPVSVNVAMPAGLLVNELLTNAFKYAFEGRDGGTISVEAAREADDLYKVTVADDGCGFPNGVAWPAPGKLASLVVQTLRENASDVSVSVASSAEQGTRITIAFRHTAPSQRAN